MKMISSLNNFLFRVTLLDKMLFSKHLSVMLKSGVPLQEAVSSLKDQTSNPPFKEVLKQVCKDIENGQSMEKALSKHPQVFNSLYISLVATGEKSGNLEANLEYLSTQLKKKYEFNKKVESATLYPKLVLLTTFLMGGSISLFVLPKLVDLFTSLDVKLPFSTKILLFFANMMKNYGIFIAIAAVTAIVLIAFIVKTPPVKPKWHKFLLSAPVFGKLNQNMELANICRDLGIMLKSGLTINDALDTQYQSTENLVFKAYLNDLRRNIEKGKKLSDQITPSKFKYIPSIAARMIAVGEETGKLEDALIYLGDFFEEEADDATRNLSNSLEPILLLIIGAVVAFVALAIITPIYSLTSGIKR